jgi:LacI family transcriptional regulator
LETLDQSKWSKNMPKATIFDIARKAGVSIATVSYVVNKTREVSPEFRKRVEQAIRELDYTPNENARSLRRNRTNTIGLVISDNTNPFFAEIAKGVEDAAFEAGYSVMLCNTNSHHERELLYVDLLVSKSVAGIIFAIKSPEESQVKRLKEQGIPASVLYFPSDGLDVDNYIIDNFQAGYLAGVYLAGLGHTRIACLGAPEELGPVTLREKGFQKAMVDCGLDWDPDLLFPANYRFSGGEIAAKQILNCGKQVTAVFCGNDAMAIGMLRVLYEEGIRVPEDISIMGLDDILLSAYMNPPLTTISQPKQEAGYQAVKNLLERIHKTHSGGPRQFKMEVELVKRKSTAPPSHS